jgi:AAA ATPase domain
MKEPNALATVPNPFASTVVLDAWNDLPADVESIHQEAFEVCLRALDNARQGRSDSVLLMGGAGAGKTHLLARLQRHLRQTAVDAPDREAHCVFVSVKLQTSAGVLWQFVRRRLVADLLRVYGRVSQLQRLIAHQIAAYTGGGLRPWVLGMPVLPRTNEFSGFWAGTAARLQLRPALARVLEHLLHGHQPADCVAWLSGDSLPEAALAGLGLGPDEAEDREDEARQLVCQLCTLAAGSLPIVFCFDQVEALQATADDRDALFRFGQVAAGLAESDPHVLVISSVQIALLQTLEASVRDADRDRAFKRRATLGELTRDEVVRLVRSRLESGSALRALRAAHPRQPDYPFAPTFLEALQGVRPAVPRKVIAAADQEFSRLQHAARPPVDVPSFLAEELARRSQEALASSSASDTRGLLLHGLPMLGQLTGRPVRPAAVHDIDLVGDGPKPRALAICNETNMTSLGGRLRRLGQGTQADLAGLRLVRDPRLPIPRTARKTHEYLAALEKRGAALVTPSLEALAALEALRSLLSDARSGDLAAAGEAVAPATVASWLVAHLDDSLQQLSERLVAAPQAADPDAELLRALQELVLGRHLLALEEAAQALGASPQAVLALASRTAASIGVLNGPPAVLFASVPPERVVGGD